MQDRYLSKRLKLGALSYSSTILAVRVQLS
jgi:hypothetical protein